VEKVFGPSNENEGIQPVEGDIYDRRSLTHSPMAVDPKPFLPPHSKLLEPAERGQTLNWQFLYKQRKRLENNWASGRYTCFQLPHPRYPQEAHRECIYTLQYSSKWLVSGSRDKTLRKWDMETKRLVGQPLVGHTGSVLCLQFDESVEEDVLISGSSDTHVIVWRFSTGEVITKLSHAHSESVLNLRFDRRVLVTCSKDKSIKVWNRRALEPTDLYYPQQSKPAPTPAAVFTDYGFKNQPANLKLKVLPAYSQLLIFRGHSAAVNAIQVYGDEIVSASGDRHVKVWSISQNRCLMAIAAHTKGIACIQFDGRRIVTGSSDNTVRVFDRETGAEVACLSGHEHLVRTVQAGFGDLAGSEELDRQAAKEIDRKFFEARLAGRIPNPVRARARNPGSTDPKDIVAYGAKLPPGGGGGGYARIVSGSYDETVIIWKRDEKGKWVIGQRLRQEDAARDALKPYQLYNEEPYTTAMGIMMRRRQENVPQLGTNANSTIAESSTALPSQPVQLHPQLVPAANVPSAAAASTTSFTPTPNPANNQPTTNTSNATSATQPTNPTTTEAAGESNALGGTARVFKLQFDARRIICCSQEPRIVGWDFADNDEDIIEASRVFQGIE
jgi:F-box and WD-40 domain protein 1/11